jgi:hypothetical protein
MVQPRAREKMRKGWLALQASKGAFIMQKAWGVFLPVLLIVGFWTFPVLGADTLVRFKGGIGVIPVRGNEPPFTANVVLGIIPAGQPWVIRHLEARVKTNGQIQVEGEGLIRAGGNIGTPSADPLVATLFCGTVPHNSGAVVPESNGDFSIDDVLTPVPPDPCEAPVLLIRNATTGNWFAAGIPKD